MITVTYNENKRKNNDAKPNNEILLHLIHIVC